MVRRQTMAGSRVAAGGLGSLPNLSVQLRIELKGVKPSVWRCVLVPESITLGKLHVVLQTVMGWGGGHLHEYEVDGLRYGMKDPELDFGEPVADERRMRLKTLIERGVRRLTYVYDFGDDWEHLIKIEDLVLPRTSTSSILCIAGANACPPDDVGGVWGYDEFRAAITDPQHEQHQEMTHWIGYPFDPAAFDIEAVNQMLATIKA